MADMVCWDRPECCQSWQNFQPVSEIEESEHPNVSRCSWKRVSSKRANKQWAMRTEYVVSEYNHSPIPSSSQTGRLSLKDKTVDTCLYKTSGVAQRKWAERLPYLLQTLRNAQTSATCVTSLNCMSSGGADCARQLTASDDQNRVSSIQSHL